MTREEAIEFGNMWLKINEDCKDSNTYEFFQMALEAMKQQSTLGKIRDEIKALSPEPTPYDVINGDAIKDAVWEILTDVLEIIDKYRESEDKE